MIDITDLLEKVKGSRLDSAEFTRLVQAVIDNQNLTSIINSKFGFAIKYRDTVEGKSYLYFFKDEDTYNSWLVQPTEENAPICITELPEDSGVSSYVVKLETNSETSIEGSSRDININLRFTSQYYNPIDQSLSDSGEDATIVIQRQMEGSDSWTTVGTISSFPSSDANTGPYRTLNLRPYIVNGTQYLRFAATGNISGEVTTLVTFTINLAEMEASFAINWGNCFVYNEEIPSTSTITIPLHISGTVHKFLYYELYSSANNKLTEGSLDIGTSEYIESTYQSLVLYHPQTADVCRIRVRLRYGNTNVYTDWIEQKFMVSVVGNTTVLLCINNITNPVYNWTNQHMLDYAVYNPNVITGSNVSFELKDINEETTWMSINTSNVVNGNIYDFTPYLSIENSTPSGPVRLFSAKLNIKVQNVLQAMITYNVDNTNDFAPTAGANFVLSPSSRSNYDSDRQVIHNETNLETEQKLINAIWENVVFENDGWISEDNIKMLRILAGSKVTIPFESYSNTTKYNGLTIEITLRTKNVSNEEYPILKMGKEISGQFVGLILYPKKGYFFKSANNVALFQDIEWRENVATTIAINIVPNLTIKGRTINLVRMFVNGCINREFLFSTTDNFWDGSNSGGIQIGGTSADIDIYSMRIFKEKLLSTLEIFNDYVASVTDIDTKIALIQANNITEGGVIKYELAKQKYNTIVWKGVYPDKNNQVETRGDLKISIIGDSTHSGTINNMKLKGQGTSSKRYLYWNGSWSFNDDSVFVNDNDETIGAYYQLRSTSPRATKLVGKINWASSPQSHKAGMCDIVNVLYDNIFDGSNGYEASGIKSLEGYEHTRIAVEEEPFLFFVQADANSEPIFYGNMTFGSAKGDKLTFGYDKSNNILKNYLMIEGSDQTPVLTLCQVPWFTDEVIYNEEEEYYEYNGMGSFDVTLGNRASIQHFIDAFNQCFYYSTRIKYYNGRLDTLQLDTNADKSYQYFIVGQSYDNFKVYRYDWLNKLWVNAGITKTNGVPDEVDINTQLDLNFQPSDSDFEGMLAAVKAARIEKFRAIAGNYFHVNDTLFGMQINKFMGASDNRAKNTYPYYDPVDNLIRFASDDNDTILPFNNQGQKQKPYWVEEHDFDSRVEFNSYFWAASGNAMYNLFEDAYPNELRAMMRKIMTTMNNLGNGYGEGGIMGFFDRYFFKIQKYFPAIAYNECARLWYEWAKILYNAGEYTNDTDPITQSLGDQLQCEKEWLSKRIFYIASYCMYAPALGGSIEFRQQNSAVYSLTTAMKMYLYMQLGTSYRYPTGYNLPKRCEADETVEIECEGSDSIQTYIIASEYLKSLGDLAPVGVSGATAFANGKRLTSLKLGDVNSALVNFKPNTIVSFPQNAETIDLRNIGSTLTSIGSLASLTKLKNFYSTNTAISSLELPQTNNIVNLYLNSSLTTLVLKNQRNITNFGYTPTNLKNLTIGNTNIPEQTFIKNWIDTITENFNQYSLTADNINWTNFAATDLVKLCSFNTLILKGTIRIDSNSITSQQYNAIYEKIGALIESGELNLIYSNKITISVSQSAFVGGSDEPTITINSLNANPLTIYFNGSTTSEIIEIQDKVETIVNNQRIITGKLVAQEVEYIETIEITVSDGEVTSDMYNVYIRPNVHINSVNLYAASIYMSEIGSKQITATLGPIGYSDTPTLSWFISGVKDTSLLYIDYDNTKYYVKKYSDNSVVAYINIQGTGFNNYITFNELIPSFVNDADIIVGCRVYDGQTLRATGTIGIVAHSYYQPYACQTFDDTQPNYNPWLMVSLYSIGALTDISEDFLTDSHKHENADGSIGYHITISEASALSGKKILISNTVTDSIGLCYKSYTAGIFSATTYQCISLYGLKYFNGLQYGSSQNGSSVPNVPTYLNNTIIGANAVGIIRFNLQYNYIHIGVNTVISGTIEPTGSGIFIFDAEPFYRNVNQKLAVSLLIFTMSTPPIQIYNIDLTNVERILVPTGSKNNYILSEIFSGYEDLVFEYNFDTDPLSIVNRYDGISYPIGTVLVNIVKQAFPVEGE